MSKTKRFDIESNSPHGTTFAGNKSPSFAGSSNSKKSSRFGIGDGDPNGTTFVKNTSHISFPKASGTPSDKTKSQSSGQGKYSPASKGPQDFGGSVPVGKSSRK